jgi:hypothetical protein
MRYVCTRLDKRRGILLSTFTPSDEMDVGVFFAHRGHYRQHARRVAPIQILSHERQA